MIKRKANEPPSAISRDGMQFHHVGIPTDKIRPGERYLEQYRFHVSGFDTSPYGIEWMRFEKDSPISEIIRTVPHVAFTVKNLESAIEGKELIGDICTPSKGVRTVMILENGAPVEFLEFGDEAE
ncbi:hypothetical protein JW948_01260 [bacterium]|nr:hypothetical protein [bacterium]